MGSDNLSDRYCVDLPVNENFDAEEIGAFYSAGFKKVHISATDAPYTEDEISKVFDAASERGITPVNLHPYYKYNGFFWHDCLERRDAIEFNKNQLRLCKSLGIDSMAVHPTQGKGNDIISAYGVDAFKELTEEAERCGIVLCVENLRVHLQLTPIFSAIDSPCLKFCYDTGHHNAFAKERDFLNEFGGRMYFTHIHDNDGQSDSHLLPMDGNIDFSKMKNDFEKLGYHKELNLEIHPSRQNYTGDDLYGYLIKGRERLIKIFG